MDANLERKQLTEQLFTNREYNISHPTYDSELEFYNMICDGDIESLKKLHLENVFFDNERGILSKNPVRNARYHLLVTVTMATRFCIEKGMHEQRAYGKSDVYIRKADEATTIEEINQLYYKLVFDFAEEMAEIKRSEAISKNLRLALDYIYDHLNERLGVAEIAEYAGISESQLRRDFRTYLSTSPADFVREKKVEFAKNRLVYSDISYVDLANDLGFASHSHFIKIFKEHTEMTPMEYRNKKYRKHFVGE